MHKIKVVWICQFTNEELQNLLPIRKRTKEFAPWIPNLVKGFENSDEVELHVLAPHPHLKKSTTITLRSVTYHFIAFGIPILHKPWPSRLPIDVLTNFSAIRKRIFKKVSEINPHLINIFGAEGALSSSSFLDLKSKFPIITTIQGFIGQSAKVANSNITTRKRVQIEEIILRECNYFACEMDSSNYISKYNPKHKFFEFDFPVNEEIILNLPEVEKKYDCLYYGRLTKTKGVHDFVRVVSEIKKTKPDVKACIIGHGNIVAELKSLAIDLDCLNNIEFTGFINTQDELFRIVKSAKVLLVPSYFDRLPSTIREAMFLRIPVVAYASGGIPFANEKQKNIELVVTGEYIEMAHMTLDIIQNSTKYSSLIADAYSYAKNEFSLKALTNNLVKAYKELLSKKSYEV